MSICINHNDPIWKKIIGISPNIDIAFNTYKGGYDFSKDESLKDYVNAETDKYYHINDKEKFYAIRGFTKEEAQILINSNFSILLLPIGIDCLYPACDCASSNALVKERIY